VGTQTEIDAYGLFTASLSPTSLNFNIVALGTTTLPKAVTLSNVGSTTIGISSISIGGVNASEYGQTNNCGSSLAGGASCTISVSFTPSAEGAQPATLTVVDGGGTQTASLTGTGTAVKFVPGGLNFGSQKVGTTGKAKTVTMTNLATTTLTITSIAVGGTNAGDFAQTNNCGGSLAGGASCTITVTFTPTATGSRSGNITVKDSGVTSPQKVTLSGTGS